VSGGPPQRTLVLDENLNPRLATELTRRGRNATRVQELGFGAALTLSFSTSWTASSMSGCS